MYTVVNDNYGNDEFVRTKEFKTERGAKRYFAKLHSGRIIKNAGYIDAKLIDNK